MSRSPQDACEVKYEYMKVKGKSMHSDHWRNSPHCMPGLCPHVQVLLAARHSMALSARTPTTVTRRKRPVPEAIVISDDDEGDIPIIISDGEYAAGPSRGRATAKKPRQPRRTKEPKPKRAKKEPEEKRTDRCGRAVRFSASPSQKVSDRIQRAMPGSSHRMFLIEAKELTAAGSTGGPSKEFTVLGATGNVYQVRLDS